MKKIVFFLLMLSFSPLGAVLSPLNQSLKEINAILDDPRFESSLTENEAILSIQKVDKRYEITTPESKLFVELVPLPQSFIGASQFGLRFHMMKEKVEKVPSE